MDIRKEELLLLSICHLLVDGVCAATLFAHGNASQIVLALFVYNTCAFTTQCLTGMLPDRYGRGRQFVILSAVILVAGAMMPLPLTVQAAVVGLGNSLFHVSGGYLTLRESTNMGPLGVFVAPGAIGLFLGTAFPALRLTFIALLVAASLVILVMELRAKDDTVSVEQVVALDVAGEVESHDIAAQETTRQRSVSPRESALLAGLLLVAVAARAVGGSAVTFSWKTSVLAGGIMVAAVFLGKTFGGFVADRLGIVTAATISVLAASALLIFCSDNMVLSLIGQFALNLSMPITLYLIYKLYPESPGFAFGLAASALWPGTLLGKLIKFTGIYANLLTFVCFAAGLAAIYITERRLRGNEKDQNRTDDAAHYAIRNGDGVCGRR